MTRQLDIHFHGGGGQMVGPHCDVAKLEEWLGDVDYVAALPAFADAPPDDLVEHVRQAAAVHAASPRCVGLRLEGVFLSPAMRGTWPVESLRKPDPELLTTLAATARAEGCPLRIVDLAPELDGCTELILSAVAAGVIASIGHTTASADEVHRAIGLGCSLTTHTWNAMPPLHHRGPGPVGVALTDERVFVELIADGVHVDPLIAKITYACAPGRVIAISDASPLAGLVSQSCTWLGHTISERQFAIVNDEDNLAGSWAPPSQLREWLESVPIPADQITHSLVDAPRALLGL